MASITVGILKALLTTDTAQFESGMRKAVGVSKSSTSAINKEFARMTGSAQSFSTAITSAFAGVATVTAIAAFGRAVLEAGDHIQKMADQTGLSIKQVQALEFIAGQTGVTVEGMVSAIQNLQMRLGDDNTGAAGAMKRLGINMETFNQLDSYQQMIALSGALQTLTDKNEFAATAAALFGKNWKEIAPALKADMEAIGDSAIKMSDETVQSLDRIGDKLKALAGISVVAGGTIIAAVADALTAFDPAHFGHTESWMKRYEFESRGLAAMLEIVPPVVGRVGVAMGDTRLSANALTIAEMDLTAAARNSIDAHRNVSKEITETAKKQKEWNEAILIGSDRLRYLFGTLRVTTPEIHNQAGELEALLPDYEIFEGRARQVTDAMYQGIPAMKKNTEALRVYAKSTVQSIGENLKLAIDSVPDLLVRAFTGGGGFLGALKALGVQFAEAIVKPMIAAMIKRLAAAKLGQAIAGAFGVGATGASAAAAGTAAGVGAGAAAGTAAGAGGAAAGAGAGGAGASLAALATNPWTIGIAAAIGGALLLKHFWGRGGKQTNDKRDQFLAQFGHAGTGAGSGFRRLADRLFALTGSGQLFGALSSAGSVNSFREAQAAIVATLGSVGQRVKSFSAGGFVPPGAVVAGLLHGGSFGEDITPRTSAGGGGSTIINISVNAIDANGMDDVFRTSIIPRLKNALVLNQNGLLSVAQRTVR